MQKRIQIKFLLVFLPLLLSPLSLFFLLRPSSAFGPLATDTEFQMRISPPQSMHRLEVPFPSLEPFNSTPLLTEHRVLITSCKSQLSPSLILPHFAFPSVSAPPIRPHSWNPLDSEHLLVRQGPPLLRTPTYGTVHCPSHTVFSSFPCHSLPTPHLTSCLV